MFNKDLDYRLKCWLELRKSLEICSNPLEKVWDFWRSAPFSPFNKNIDPNDNEFWPTPWEIISDNIYDDFTKALMIGITLKYTDRMRHSLIELKILEDTKLRQYNLVYVDNLYVINYSDNGPIDIKLIPDQFDIKNQLELKYPR